MPMISIASRLDHVIVEVPKIERAHARLIRRGFDEAWPIGRYWPWGMTSGIALGGVNLELMQPDRGSDIDFDGSTPRSDGPVKLRMTTIVFAPTSVQDAAEAYGGRVIVKTESDPAKLGLRGFPSEMRDREQVLCINVFVAGERYFFCAYGAFLAARLASSRFAAPLGEVEAVSFPYRLSMEGPLAGPRIVQGEAGFSFAGGQFHSLLDLLG